MVMSWILFRVDIWSISIQTRRRGHVRVHCLSRAFIILLTLVSVLYTMYPIQCIYNASPVGNFSRFLNSPIISSIVNNVKSSQLIHRTPIIFNNPLFFYGMQSPYISMFYLHFIYFNILDLLLFMAVRSVLNIRLKQYTNHVSLSQIGLLKSLTFRYTHLRIWWI